MRLAAMLKVVEERGTEQYGEIAKAMRRFDPKTADIIERIVEDEARHIKYARAIALRFAPNHEAYEQVLEAGTFERHGNDFLEYALEHGLLTTSALGKPFWKLIIWLGKSRNQAQEPKFTPVWPRAS
jgi:rubrerythrin